jgi:hypothetical protein
MLCVDGRCLAQCFMDLVGDWACGPNNFDKQNI